MISVTAAQPHNAAGALAVIPDFSAPTANQRDIDNVLEQSREWISILVQRYIPRRIIPVGEIPKEIDDLIQTALIAFWHRLVSENVQIVCPKAYISSIVRSHCIDLVRRQKKWRHVQLVSLGDESEPYPDNIVSNLSNGKQDPTLEYGYKELVAEVVEDVLTLPSCQQRAMICLLKDEVKEMSLLVEAFEQHGIDIRAINWPQDAVALQRMRSSLSIARKKLRTLRDNSTSERQS